MISALLFAAAAGNFVPPRFTIANATQLQEGYGGGEPGAVLIDAKVDPKGHITECHAQAVDGSEGLAATICSRVERVRVKPASIGGSSSYGVVRSLLTFSDSGSPYKGRNGAIKQAADMEVQVNKLPAGQATLRINAIVLVDPTGKPQACYGANDAPRAYADVACTQVSGLTFGRLEDDDGKPVGYVSSLIIDFELASASASAAPGG